MLPRQFCLRTTVETGGRRCVLVSAGSPTTEDGVGSKVEVFAGGLRQKWEVPSSSGYLGQNALTLVAGLNQAKEADVVRLLWPTGVVQDEVLLASGPPPRHSGNRQARQFVSGRVGLERRTLSSSSPT